ncbi:hypothetical protein [uncultured Roseobacter sp.]|uniref:hypothetical protein n=1 Tax=uncultured Roseobacter sp. TaxID=114847 RepID=UPI002629BFED|nr:hypothetical protein [uncultured Roseobacter sp.]
MTSLCPLKPADIADVTQAAREMLEESEWQAFGLDPAAVEAMARRVIYDQDKPRLGVIARGRDTAVCGVMVAEIDDLDWVLGRRAINVFTFVTHQRAGSLTGPRLIRSFLTWAHSHRVDAVEFGVSSGVRLQSSDRLLRAFGFRPVQRTYLMRSEDTDGQGKHPRSPARKAGISARHDPS